MSQSAPSIVVVKIGGSLLTGPDAYRRVAEFIHDRIRRTPEERLLVVVSAENGVTDSLLRIAETIDPRPDPAALDLLWSTGELRSVAVVGLWLKALGVAAVGLNVHQTGVTADDGRTGLRLRRVRAALARHQAVVVPGFLATRAGGGIVSLGRGGSDLTAVLLAGGLGARRCELVKDVPGYFTSDPNRDAGARHLPSLGFDEALAMADAGCDLVQRKAIEAAAASGLPLVIRSLDRGAPKSILGRGSRGLRAAEYTEYAAAEHAEDAEKADSSRSRGNGVCDEDDSCRPAV